jgi:hypothetical protein
LRVEGLIVINPAFRYFRSQISAFKQETNMAPNFLRAKSSWNQEIAPDVFPPEFREISNKWKFSNVNTMPRKEINKLD